MTEIETDRLLLRRWRDEDLDTYARICADPEVVRYVTGPLTHEQSEEPMARFVRHWEERVRVVGRQARGVGRVHRLYRPSPPKRLARGCTQDCEVGWRLDRAYWGRRLATEGALASVLYGFEKLGLERIISIIHHSNLASRRVAEKA